MPEGDTVWQQAALLRRALAGQQLTRCDIRVPAFATVDFSGETVTSVDSRGKHLLIHVAGHVIHSRLKMEGIWQIYPGEGHGAGRTPSSQRGGPSRLQQKWHRPAHTARCILGTDQSTAVGFSLGILEVLPEAQLHDALGYLGPDLLGADWDADDAVRRLGAEPGRPIGLALLDQGNLAGIGNIYRNELCFLARIHPESEVAKVPGLAAMVDTAKRLLEANKDRPVRSTTGGPARGDAATWVYGLAGKPCKRCGTLVQHGMQSDPAFPERTPRGIYFCPRCQPRL